MAKTKKTNKKKQSFFEKVKQAYEKHRFLYSALIVVLILLLIWAVPIAIERYNFYRVERVMDNIENKINSQVNGLYTVKERSCGTSSQVYGDRLGGCSIAISFSKNFKDNESAKKQAQAIDEIIKSTRSVELRKQDAQQASDYYPFKKLNKLSPGNSDEYFSMYEFAGVKNPKCEASYEIPLTGNKESVFELKGTITCYLSGFARFQYFPINPS